MGDELRRAGPGPDRPRPAVRPAPPCRPRRPSGRTGRRSAPGPAMAGKDGRLSCPTAQTIAVDDLGPLGAVGGADGQRPRRAVSSKRASVTSLRKRMHSPSPRSFGRRLEVGQQIGLGREARDPVVGLGEGEAVELVGDVDAAARVHVLEPGAAHVAVLLEHRDRHPGLAQPVRRRQAGGAGADDGAAEVAPDVVDVPRGLPRVAALERELLGQEALPVLGGAGAPTRNPKMRRRSPGVSLMVGPARGQVVRQARRPPAHVPRPSPRGRGRSPGTSSWSWSGANSSRSNDRSPVRCATAQSSGCTSAAAQAACDCTSSPWLTSPPMRTSLRRRVPPGGQRPMCLPSSAIWLFTSTVRGSLSMAVARLSAVQRSSVSTESAIDHPA